MKNATMPKNAPLDRANMRQPKGLVTGAAGWTAQSIRQALGAAGYRLVLFDLPSAVQHLRTDNESDRVVPGDIRSFPEVMAASEGADAVVHLVVAVGEDGYREPMNAFTVNVAGTYNVFEAARLQGISKVILMSEAAVHLSADSQQTLDARTDWRSSPDDDHLYDLTKRLQEEIARDFCATFGMTAVALRAGHIVDGRRRVDPHDRPLSNVTYARGGWVCRFDLADACVRALDYQGDGYHAFHIVGSAEAAERFDIGTTVRELGLRFTERFRDFPVLR